MSSFLQVNSLYTDSKPCKQESNQQVTPKDLVHDDHIIVVRERARETSSFEAWPSTFFSSMLPYQLVWSVAEHVLLVDVAFDQVLRDRQTAQTVAGVIVIPVPTAQHHVTACHLQVYNCENIFSRTVVLVTKDNLKRTHFPGLSMRPPCSLWQQSRRYSCRACWWNIQASELTHGSPERDERWSMCALIQNRT